MTTKRKPYVREMTPSWWKNLKFYKFYMMRELTALPALWFSCLLIYFLFSLKGGNFNPLDAFAIMRNPIVMLLNIVALAGALLHTKSWFDLTPKAANIVTKSGQKVAPSLLVKVMWGVTAAASLIILLLVL